MDGDVAKLCARLLNTRFCSSSLGLLLVTSVIFNSSPIAAQDAMLGQAIQAYSEAMEVKPRDQRLAAFARSEQLFRQILQKQQEKGQPARTELLVNLGNAALQAEHIGVAIVAFRRALTQEPSHSQALQNLDFARSTLPDWAIRSTSNDLADTLFFWQRLYSAKQVAAASALSFLFAAVLLSISIWTRQTLWRNAAVVPFLIWIVLAASLFARSDASTDDAVIISSGATLFSADSENAAPRIADPLPDGAEVTILQARDNWCEIQISGRTGWVRSSSLARLAPE